MRETLVTWIAREMYYGVKNHLLQKKLNCTLVRILTETRWGRRQKLLYSARLAMHSHSRPSLVATSCSR
jgi:hypothetical protein